MVPWAQWSTSFSLTRSEEIVPVEVEIWPSSTSFAAGDKLQVIVQGRDIYAFEGVKHGQLHERTRNAGRHVIHAGGKYDSHLLVPVVY